MTFTFLKKEEDRVVFVGNRLDIYLPKSYFDDDMLAEELGTEIKTIGCFIMKYYKDLDSTKYETYQLSLPEDITFSFSEFKENVKEVLIERDFNDDENDGDIDSEDDVEDAYNVYTLYQNDLFITNLNHAKSYKNTEKLVKLHQKGKLPKTIRYSDFIKLYIENMDTNSTDLQVPSLILELTISELARYKKNPEIPFRQVIGKNNSRISELDYKQVSIKDLAMLTSTFTAMTSENINKAIIYSVSKSRTEGKEAETPIEPTIKY